MTRYGIEQEILERILSVLRSNPEIEQIILFGSRAKGNFKNGSDIDIALKGAGLTFQDMQDLRIALDDLNLPWEIDLLHYDTANDAAVKEQVDRVGIVF